MKVLELFESRGEQALQFADYLDGGFVSQPYVSALQAIGDELLKRGWKFIAEPNPRFVEDKPDGFAMSLPFGARTSKLGKSKVHVLYTSASANGLNWARDEYHIIELTGTGLDDALQEVKDKAFT